jgi:hypothetical protein
MTVLKCQSSSHLGAAGIKKFPHKHRITCSRQCNKTWSVISIEIYIFKCKTPINKYKNTFLDHLINEVDRKMPGLISGKNHEVIIWHFESELSNLRSCSLLADLTTCLNHTKLRYKHEKNTVIQFVILLTRSGRPRCTYQSVTCRGCSV